jgi:thioredoxin-like negative regulator of GroEL
VRGWAPGAATGPDPIRSGGPVERGPSGLKRRPPGARIPAVGDPPAAGPPAMASTHPHFDDKGALDWTTDLDVALQHARSQRRLVFVEYGREQCGQCRALVQSVIPRPEIAELLNGHFVPLAIDCDDAPDEVEELALKLEDATMLPFVLIVDAQGQFVDGHSGAVDAAGLARWLEGLVEARTEEPRE